MTSTELSQGHAGTRMKKRRRRSAGSLRFQDKAGCSLDATGTAFGKFSYVFAQLGNKCFGTSSPASTRGSAQACEHGPTLTKTEVVAGFASKGLGCLEVQGKGSAQVHGALRKHAGLRASARGSAQARGPPCKRAGLRGSTQATALDCKVCWQRVWGIGKKRQSPGQKLRTGAPPRKHAGLRASVRGSADCKVC